MLDWIQQQIATNDFFAGGLVLGAFGVLIAHGRSWAQRAFHYTVGRFCMTLEIPDREVAFMWFDRWLASHDYARKRARRLSLRTDNREGDERPIFHLVPAPGQHVMFFRGRLVMLSRTRLEAKEALADGFREILNVRIYARRRAIILELLEEVRRFERPESEPMTQVFGVASWGAWEKLSEQIPRDPESVVWGAGVLEGVIADARRFLGSRETYVRRGVPFRRGYLLYGPPGNGKTSGIAAIAAALDLSIHLLDVSECGNRSLRQAVGSAPPKSLIVIEDLDRQFDDEGRLRESEKGPTIDGLLNAIDGICSSDGRVMIFTANHPDRLPPALRRAGRIDRMVEVSGATPEKVQRMALRFFPDDAAARELASIVEPGTAMAEVQAALTRADQAGDAVRELLAVRAEAMAMAG